MKGVLPSPQAAETSGASQTQGVSLCAGNAPECLHSSNITPKEGTRHRELVCEHLLHKTIQCINLLLQSNHLTTTYILNISLERLTTI